MSNLKHQSIEQLHQSKDECERQISQLKSRLNGQMERLRWINDYIYQKTPVELSIKEIESRLGHRVIIK